MPEREPGKAAVQGWLEAVRDGIAEEMRRDPHILYFGEGTGERGRVSGVEHRRPGDESGVDGGQDDEHDRDDDGGL